MLDINEFSIRNGQTSDCLDIAQLINESSNGAIEYLFSNFSQNAKPEEILMGLLMREVHYSYANTLIAEINGEVRGMALSFPASGLMLGNQMQERYTPEQLQYIKYFAENKFEGCWHLDAICIDEQFRGQGFGGQLLEAVKQQVRDYEFSLLEVFVSSENNKAVEFYQQHGFEEKKQIDTSNHEFVGLGTSLVLMTCDI